MRNIQNHDVKIFTDNIETTAIEQIERLLTIPAFGGCKIRVMPDVHAGAGCVIGFTGDLGDKVIHNIVGVDIGCGILAQPFTCMKEIDYHKYAPLPQKYMDAYRESKNLIKQMRCYRELKETKSLNLSIGGRESCQSALFHHQEPQF